MTEESSSMGTFSPEEMILYAKHLEEVLDPGTQFVLILSNHQQHKAGAICTMPPELAGDLKKILAELSQREPQFNN